MNNEKKGMLAAGIAYAIFGVSYLFSKMALEVAEPVTLLCCRFFVTVLVMNLLAGFRLVKMNLKGRNLLGPILLGISQPILYFVLENYGLKYTTTSFTGMVSSVGPVFTAALGAMMLREKPNMKQWLCIAVSISGVMMVSLGGSGGENTLAGCLCLLGAYLCGSIYSILVRRLSKDFSAFELTYVMFTEGFLFFAALLLIQNGAGTGAVVAAALSHGQFIISALFLGGVVSIGAFLLVNYSLARIPVARSAIFNCMSTLFSVLAGVIVMKDPFTWVSAAAFVLMMAGMWGVNRFADKMEENE